MRWALVSILMTASTFASGQGATLASTHATDERAIIQLRDALLKAYDAGDVKTLSEIEDDDFTLAGDFGQVTKQQHLDRFADEKSRRLSLARLTINFDSTAM